MKELFKPELKNILFMIVGYSLLSLLPLAFSSNKNALMAAGIVSSPTLLLVIILYIGYCFYNFFYGKYATITRTLPTDKTSPFKTFILYTIGLCVLIALVFMFISIIQEFNSAHVWEYQEKTFIQNAIWFGYIGFTSFCGYLLTISLLMLVISILYSSKFTIKNNYIIIIIIAIFCLFFSFWIYMIGMLTNVLSLFVSALAFWLTSYLYTNYGIIQN